MRAALARWSGALACALVLAGCATPQRTAPPGEQSWAGRMGLTVQGRANDSFSAGLLDHPHWTRPEVWRDAGVPEVLMSGDHAKIARWRRQQALGQTWLKRPELLDALELDEDSRALLREFIAQQR